MSEDSNIPPADELATVREQLRVLQRREAELRALMLTDPEARVGNRFVVSIRTIKQQRVDLDLLRSDYPDVATAVTYERSMQFVYLSGRNESGKVVPLLRQPPWFKPKKSAK